MSIFRDCRLSYNFRDIFSTRISTSNCQPLVATSIFLNLLLSTSSFNHLLHYHSFNIFTSSPVTAQNVVLFESAFVKSSVGWRKMRQPIDVDRTSLVTVWFVIAHRENLKYVAYSYCFFEYKEKLKYG